MNTFLWIAGMAVLGVALGAAAHLWRNRRDDKARSANRARLARLKPIHQQMEDETPLPRESDWEIPAFAWPETPVKPGIGEH